MLSGTVETRNSDNILQQSHPSAQYISRWGHRFEILVTVVLLFGSGHAREGKRLGVGKRAHFLDSTVGTEYIYYPNCIFCQ